MGIITIIIVIIVTIVITFIATCILLKRGEKGEKTQNNWLNRVVSNIKVNNEKKAEPSLIDRLKEVLNESNKRYERTDSVRGIVLEREKRINSNEDKTENRDKKHKDKLRYKDNERYEDIYENEDIYTKKERKSSTGQKEKRGDKKERDRKRVFEERCRDILEKIFNKSFPKKRPAWLRNDERGTNTGYKLELDCYNSELKLALEYNGKQHRVYPNTWHETKKDFDDQKKRDRLKVIRCEEENVNLIVVPDTIEYDDLYSYITERLEEMGIVEIQD